MNTILIIFIIAALSIFIYFYFVKSKKSSTVIEVEDDLYTFPKLVEFVRDSFNGILKTNLNAMNITKEEYEKKIKNKNQIRKALKSCTYGDANEKNYIKEFIRDILLKNYKIDETNINRILNFSSPRELSIQDKFEILLYFYKKKHGFRALERLILDNGLDKPKQNEEGQGIRYVINSEEIELLYIHQVKKLTYFEDKINIVVQRVYQMYKGYGVVDEIRDMKIDGVSGGVSGIPSAFFQNEYDYSNKFLGTLPSSYDSIWIFFKGKTIHLSFLSFGSEHELQRICKNIYRYNNPGQLSESNGYKVNEMKDGSRVVVARPPFCESWVFFVRKFDSAENKNPEDLITDKNKELPINTSMWIIKTCRVFAITGSQGTGKTTYLMSLIKFINRTFTLRIQEMAFELHLRKLYPFNNIVSFRETPSISGQEGLDLQKKTDGTVNILGEVATAPVASWMLQMAQVASLFTIFTHHAKTTYNLILSLRNNLLQTGVFSNEKVAEQQVAEIVNFDVHLFKNEAGHRYIERITEIIPVSQDANYPENYKNAFTYEDKICLFLETFKEFFVRMTDRKTFETKDIVIWDSGEYKAANKLSKLSYEAMCKHLCEEEINEFNSFLQLNWGGLYE